MHTAIRSAIVLILFLAGVMACSRTPEPDAAPADAATGSQLWVLPAGNGAGQPDLSLAPDG